MQKISRLCRQNLRGNRTYINYYYIHALVIDHKNIGIRNVNVDTKREYIYVQSMSSYRSSNSNSVIFEMNPKKCEMRNYPSTA